MGSERRKTSRVRCRFSCQIRGPRASGSGTVLDISEGGLSVQTQAEFEHGESLAIQIEATGKTVEVEALVWHRRRTRQRSTGATFWVLGLMLVKGPDAYFGLLPRVEPQKSTAEPETETAPETAPEMAPEATRETAPEEECAEAAPEEECAEAAPEEECAELHAYRIRVKHRTGPRTRVLSLSARSAEEARSLATAGLDDWKVIEVVVS